MEQIDQIDGIQIATPSLMHGLIRPEEGRTDFFGIDERMLTETGGRLRALLQKNNDHPGHAALVELAEVGD